MKIKQLVSILVIVFTIIPLLSSLAQTTFFDSALSQVLLSFSQSEKADKEAKVTFIELGSVRCIPCQKMEKVLDSIREIYPQDVKVVFHDVWTQKGKPYATQYDVKRIPTQIFIDKDGKIFYRHVGYFPFEELKKILIQAGVKE